MTPPRRRSPVRRFAAALVALGLLLPAGCGKDADTGSSGPTTSLTITVITDEGADPQTYELTCDPAGGDHPQPAEACKALDRAGADVFEPVSEDQACTQLFGGPQTATVTGTFDGDKVDAAFSRANGCEVDRWDQLGTTFFDVPLL
ncbi:SSI family serine proteinase inhibitor [Aeromicrobium sp.]|uniref:SSI family serine proteinase inhibitor n=1 Tax=Aeromicrobium sp. TaxID=1871063 RepID=UPI0030BF21DD